MPRLMLVTIAALVSAGGAIGVSVGDAGRMVIAEWPASVDTARTKAALLRADSALASHVRVHGGAAFIDAFASDAVILVAGQPIMRASELHDGVAQSEATASFSWNTHGAIASADGRFGCTYGSASYPGAATDMAVRAGVYVTCWQRDGDDRWVAVAHQRNQRGSADAVATSIAMPHSATFSVAGDPARDAAAADADFARLASGEGGPAPAFARFVADDGVLFAAPDFPSGATGVQRALAAFPADRVLAWQPAASFGSGGLAVTVGNATIRTRATDVEQSRTKYLTVWRQRDDGRWEFVLDFGSSR